VTDHAHTTPANPADDLAAAFQIEGWPVRGRLVRLGETIDAILSAHNYPEPVAALLGEACALAALVGSSLKFEGRLIVQAQGDGPVRYVVADYDTQGHMRGYCRFDEAEVAEAVAGLRPAGRALAAGAGCVRDDAGPRSRLRTDAGDHADRGREPVAGGRALFPAVRTDPDQGPSVGRFGDDGRGHGMAAGGALIQLIAGDDARGSTEEVWDRSRALFQTLGDDELLDPTITPETLLFRLFHEDGVRLEDARALVAQCRCSRDRIAGVLTSFKPEERAEMVEADGKIRVTCEYCATVYELA
jgi:molecular chaperone Hsp33